MTITLIERIITLEDGREFILYCDINESGDIISQSFNEVTHLEEPDASN